MMDNIFFWLNCQFSKCNVSDICCTNIYSCSVLDKANDCYINKNNYIFRFKFRVIHHEVEATARSTVYTKLCSKAERNRLILVLDGMRSKAEVVKLLHDVAEVKPQSH